MLNFIVSPRTAVLGQFSAPIHKPPAKPRVPATGQGDVDEAWRVLGVPVVEICT